MEKNICHSRRKYVSPEIELNYDLEDIITESGYQDAFDWDESQGLPDEF